MSSGAARGWRLFGAALAAGFVLGYGLTWQPYSVIYNGTPSVEKGFYLVKAGVPPSVGALATFHYPQDRARLHPTTAALLGRHSLRVLKPVSAGPGAFIVFEDDEVWRCPRGEAADDNSCEFLGKGLGFDRQGRVLPLWRKGAYQLGADEWYMGAAWMHPRSLDSRYYGPISGADIEGAAWPIYTWQ